MDHFDRDRVVRHADRFAPGNPPDRDDEDDYYLRCPSCGKITKDGETCPECLMEIAEQRREER